LYSSLRDVIRTYCSVCRQCQFLVLKLTWILQRSCSGTVYITRSHIFSQYFWRVPLRIWKFRRPSKFDPLLILIKFVRGPYAAGAAGRHLVTPSVLYTIIQFTGKLQQMFNRLGWFLIIYTFTPQKCIVNYGFWLRNNPKIDKTILYV